jgi:sulfopyruvate decarboxylase subunit beta
MESMEALRLISELKPENTLVVTTMTENSEWPQASADYALTLPITGCMGKASSIGLGLALARPDLLTIVLDGDGSLLMNMGTLVTIANMAPPNLIHFVFENSVYRTTGGQPLPGVGKYDLAAIAKAAGYPNVYTFGEISELKAKLAGILEAAGPTLVCLKVPSATERTPYPNPRTTAAIARFRAALEKTMVKVRSR